MTSSVEDRTFAEELRSRDEKSLEELQRRCLVSLRQAWSDLKQDVPRLRLTLNELLPSAGRAIGSAYLACPLEDTPPLGHFVKQLRLKDLLLASAFLARDIPSILRVQAIIDLQVRPLLHKRWAAKAPAELLDDNLADLVGHHFAVIGKGEHAGQQRLATYTGRAALHTWMYATACNLVRNALRARTRGLKVVAAPEELLATVADNSQPNPSMLNREAERLRRQLVATLQQALEEFPPRRRLTAVLHWVEGMSPSEIADRLEVSRPAISEHLNLARDQFAKEVSAIAREIGDEANRSPNAIVNLLLEQLGELLAQPSDPSEVLAGRSDPEASFHTPGCV